MVALALNIHSGPPSFFYTPPPLLMPLRILCIPPDGHGKEHAVVGTGL